MSSFSSNPRSVLKQNQCHVELCDCGLRINPRTSWTRKNPGRRFLSSPVIDERKKCRLYWFLDEELPNNYYKELLFDLHNDLECLKINCNNDLVEELQDLRLEQLKVIEDFRKEKAKVQVYERVFVLMLLVVCVLCFIIGVISM